MVIFVDKRHSRGSKTGGGVSLLGECVYYAEYGIEGIWPPGPTAALAP